MNRCVLACVYCMYASLGYILLPIVTCLWFSGYTDTPSPYLLFIQSEIIEPNSAPRIAISHHGIQFSFYRWTLIAISHQYWYCPWLPSPILFLLCPISISVCHRATKMQFYSMFFENFDTAYRKTTTMVCIKLVYELKSKFKSRMWVFTISYYLLFLATEWNPIIKSYIWMLPKSFFRLNTKLCKKTILNVV